MHWHDLRELLFIALLRPCAETTSCTDMALFARMKFYLLKPILKLEQGLPSHDTFSRVFRMLDPVAFEQCFSGLHEGLCGGPAKIKRPAGLLRWVARPSGAVTKRGKSHMPPLMVTAWAAQNPYGFGERAGPGEQRGSGWPFS
jgi:hypothetical protein